MEVSSLQTYSSGCHTQYLRDFLPRVLCSAVLSDYWQTNRTNCALPSMISARELDRGPVELTFISQMHRTPCSGYSHDSHGGACWSPSFSPGCVLSTQLCQTDAKCRAPGSAVSHACFPVLGIAHVASWLLHGLGLIMCTFGAAFFFFFFFKVSLEPVPGKIWM